jgi:hypothetical protein
MAAVLTVIWWRDIPAQVVAKDRRQAHKIVLHPRFQVAIDRAAKIAGMDEWSVYLEQWRKEQRACGDDLTAEAGAEAQRLEAAHPRKVLDRLVEAGGVLDANGPGSRPGHLPEPPASGEVPSEPTGVTAGADARGGPGS